MSDPTHFDTIMQTQKAGERRQKLRTAVKDNDLINFITSELSSMAEAMGQSGLTNATLRDRLCPEALEYIVMADATPARIKDYHYLEAVPEQLKEAILEPKILGVEGKVGLHKEWVEHVEKRREIYGRIRNSPEKKATVPAPSPTVYNKKFGIRRLLPPVEGAAASILDSGLTSVGLPSINNMVDTINGFEERMSAREAEMAAEFKKMVDDVKARGSMAPAAATTVEASGEIPQGKVVIKKAGDVFNLRKGTQFDALDVPTFEWDGVHPHVPEIDEGYIFRPQELWQALYAIITNQRAYFAGHTGSGKTTLIEQVAACLCWPFMRVNFDSEVTRMDLIGRDILTQDAGVTVTKFVDGVLPQMLSGPYIGCFDEIDFVRPDVAYVMQRCLEGNGLTLTEDGGRVIKPHPMCRLFATGNTVGQGDEHGMYQGARPQSMALLDRFSIWGRVEYLESDDRLGLLKAKCHGISDEDATMLTKYVEEHNEAFTTAKVLQPISPRGMLALGTAITHFRTCLPKDSVKQAFEMVVLNRATEQDRAVLSAFVDRAVYAS